MTTLVNRGVSAVPGNVHTSVAHEHLQARNYGQVTKERDALRSF